ncbi:hypothetical protein H696_04756 [Fonticula alba]|uniref:E1 ubiquitin-activating enzyme n=1 Tax=Fonticula alba TaxID=691883 RepID=A0A058Z4Q5_FONAL|nr:hypothetical protein H696_04756 [Fonticula alba]KCV68462.1 hypothetical protein H696_04756 [Fonticula alba]|eukprot:XP_009496894.1 hypothetical protein H696_04756 [Fonticula alba]
MTDSSKIDEGLYSRQLYVFGHEAMKRMSSSDVLLVGVDGLGIEIAKNIVLAGVKSLTLFDNTPTALADLGTQFYLSEIGEPRAKASLPQLKELNPYVEVSVFDSAPELPFDALAQPTMAEALLSHKRFQVVVVVNQSHKVALALNEAQRKLSPTGCTVVTESRGTFASIFNDFGDSFVVTDPNGNEPASFLISGITAEKESVVACVEEQRHNLEDGAHVTFRGVRGMTALNDCAPRPVKVLSPDTFSIGDTSGLPAYEGGGMAIEVKMPVTMHFEPLRAKLTALPCMGVDLLVSDFAKMDRPEQLHIAFQAGHRFVEEHGRMPRPRNEEDANTLVALCQAVATDHGLTEWKPDTDLLRQFAYQYAGATAPMCGTVGGIVAQEVLKATSGKFTPISQWLFFDALEAVPPGLTEAECAPVGSRYDSQIAIFGQTMQKTIAGYRLFLVGAGAIGCEMLKNWALMGIASGPGGSITVTDMDTIERSNLNRQFLFRNQDVGKLKSACAAAAAASINPDLQGKIHPMADRVGEETEHIFGDEFFANIDCVANALDNMEARRYVDRRCVFFRKPLMESGTLGTRGNTQVVLPDITESYSSSQDPPEASIAICTLKNFPNAIEHTIQWGRDLFEGVFANGPQQVNQFLKFTRNALAAAGGPGAASDADILRQYVEHMSEEAGFKDILDSIAGLLRADRPTTFEGCVAWARHQFEHHFANNIKQLLFNFPPDAVTSNGHLFWTAPKLCPTPLVFDPAEPSHLSFIEAASRLIAQVFGIPVPDEVEQPLAQAGGTHGTTAAGYRILLDAVVVPEFVPASNVKIHTVDSEAAAEAEAAGGSLNEDQMSRLLTEAAGLPAPSSLGDLVEVSPLEFEKDDDSNFHIDFVTAVANLRASNYGIQNADRHKIKGIAGRIIPAIATTTALVTGLICLETLKVIRQEKNIEAYKNAFINLALPFVTFSEPVAPAVTKFREHSWTLWDCIEINGNPTIEEINTQIERDYNVSIFMISSGVSMLYAIFMDMKKQAARLKARLTDVLEEVLHKPVEDHIHSVVLILSASDNDTDEDVDFPFIKVNIRK